jgi:selenocysteine lyase/cysteine desulfurase
MAFRRRDLFLRVPASWAALAQALQAQSDPEDYWRMVARQFPLEPGLIYMNAANVCPASRPVMDRHLELLRDFHANPSFQNRDKYAALEDRVREKFAALLHVTAREIALVRNTSEGSNIVVQGLDLKPGDEIVITAHNHPSNNDSWKVRAKRDGLAVKVASVPVPAKSTAQLVESIASEVTPRTRVIAITHVTNTAGLKYPAREIADLARSRGAWFHLDGAQSCGAMDVDLRAIGCDSYSTSMHKWPMGPLEAGLLYVREERQKELWPSIVTAGWSDRLEGARKFEVFGQRDDPRLASLDAVADFLTMIGPNRIEQRVQQITTALKRAFAESNALELRTNLEPDLSHGVVKVGLKHGRVKEAYDTLWSRHRLAIAMTPSGDASGLRFSPHVYNTMDQVARVVEAVREVAG